VVANCSRIDRELALLEEFNRSHSVASLAEAIAARLGRKRQSKDMIAEAGLAAAPPDDRTRRRAGFSVESRSRA
jgi:hypothetical protein